ncbi:hypothetical protein [Ponticaulis sp.]|uniref:CC_3452 family protein n=1 Tax=Ponticaulis sp. TaxID=2020902 RepID=UPI000B754450|nr:hypothetical protein [Ponticaulis sp.]MAI89298.1 hypothetical protein [Ponticaulis sp.]OUY01281.1 MAG: hypothetical protein CBB65_02285 [Hyphomonadaceae bacterium TMED5]|tara:strand:+ start:29577 stop:29876 length:300 start_codon:yes stop_codon:yes gene_type:complete
MQRFLTLSALALFGALPAMASTTFTATLEAPKSETERIAAADAIWICEGETCEAVLNRRSATVRVCRHVVSEIGPVTAFGTAEDPLTPEEVSECNASLN